MCQALKTQSAADLSRPWLWGRRNAGRHPWRDSWGWRWVRFKLRVSFSCDTGGACPVLVRRCFTELAHRIKLLGDSCLWGPTDFMESAEVVPKSQIQLARSRTSRRSWPVVLRCILSPCQGKDWERASGYRVPEFRLVIKSWTFERSRQGTARSQVQPLSIHRLCFQSTEPKNLAWLDSFRLVNCKAVKPYPTSPTRLRTCLRCGLVGMPGLGGLGGMGGMGGMDPNMVRGPDVTWRACISTLEACACRWFHGTRTTAYCCV